MERGPTRHLVESFLDLDNASYAKRTCGPCRILLSTAQLGEDEDNPYDTTRCITECVPASGRGKWLPTLQLFLKYLLNEKVAAAVENNIPRMSVGTSLAFAGICSARTHAVLGVVAATRRPDGSISFPRPIGAIDRIKDRDVEIHILMAVRVRNLDLYSRAWRDNLSRIDLRRRTYNLSFTPTVTTEIPALDLPNNQPFSLRSYFPFEEQRDGRPLHVQHKESLENDVFVSWRPTVPILYARIYSKYGLQNAEWERFSIPGDANALWQYLPHHARRRAMREDDLDIRDVDHGEMSPRD